MINRGYLPQLLCPKLLRQSLSLGLEPVDSAGLDSRRAPGSTCPRLSPAPGLESHASTLAFNAGAESTALAGPSPCALSFPLLGFYLNNRSIHHQSPGNFYKMAAKANLHLAEAL